LLLITLPVAQVAPLVNNVTVPPTTCFCKCAADTVAIHIFCVPVADTTTLSEIKIKLPVVFTERFVNTLLLILEKAVAALFKINKRYSALQLNM